MTNPLEQRSGGGTTQPRLVLILSENWTMTPPSDLSALVRFAAEAEQAGFDGVMLSEHIVLGRDADAEGRPANPREFALPGNQDPATPWPDSLVLFGAIAAATTHIRLVASAIIAPLRHPLLLAKQLATLDRLSGGRLVVQPTVSWHRSEYEALGVPYERRGALLDEHLAAWEQLWQPGSASFDGRHYTFSGVYLEPKPDRASGPALWFGGQTLHDRLLRRLVAHGSGFHPLGQPSDTDLQQLATAMQEADRAREDLEMIGGIRGIFHDNNRPADLAESVAAAVPRQLARGFTTFCIKPSQFTDDAGDLPGFCRETVRLVEAATG